MARAVESDDLVRDRAALVAMLDEAAASIAGQKTRTWPTDQKVAARAVRAVLVRLQEDAGRTRNRQALEDVAERARELLAEVDVIARQAAAIQQRAALEATQQRLAIEDGRAQERHQAAAARAYERRQKELATAELDRMMPTVKELVRLWRLQGTPREGQPSPAQVLGRFEANGRPLVYYVAPPEQPASSGFWRSIGQALAGAPWGEWFTYGGVSLGLGSSRVCPALASWGPETRRVLEPIMRANRAREDDLRRVAGRRPRSTGWRAA